MRLFIAEKPDLGRDIANALGGNQKKGDNCIYVGSSDVVAWCSGHILESKKPEEYNPNFAKWSMANLPYNFNPLQLKPSKSNLLKTIASLLKDADEVIHAGDADDEGQLIVDEVLFYLNNKVPVKRIWIKDPTTKGIQKALKELKDNREYHGIYKKTLARSIADMNYGLTMTCACSLNAQAKGANGTYSIGRVQTPMLGFIVDRFIANSTHKESFFYTVNAEFENGLKARLVAPDDFSKDEKGRLINEQQINQLIIDLKGKIGEVKKHELNEKHTQPPLPFNLLTLQKAMNQKYKYTSAKTLEITQDLREKHKAITYNRSDCQYLTEEQYLEAPSLLEVLKTLNDFPIDKTIKSKAFDNNNVSAHTAIIPTESVPDLSKLSQAEKNVYEAIVKQYLIQFLPPKKYMEVKGTIVVDNRVFNYSATKTIDNGFLKYFNDIEESEDDQIEVVSNFDVIESIKVDDSFKAIKFEQDKKKTTPPPLHTESSLMSVMASAASYVENPKIKAILLAKDKGIKGEHGGIGTGATRASILELLKERAYVVLEKNKLIPTKKGIEFIQSLPKHITKPDLTALWTEETNEIESGDKTIDQFINSLADTMKELLKDIDIKVTPNTLETACTCGGVLTIKPKFVVCDKCEFKVWRTIASKELTDDQLITLIEKGTTGVIKGFKSKAGKSFGAKVTLADKATGKTTFVDYVNK